MNKMRKQYQRKFTKLLRRANKIIREDDLWLGRVEVTQISSRWEEFEDGSNYFIDGSHSDITRINICS